MNAAPPFNGQLAIITGGGSGIGAALAAALSARGARVVVCDIDAARAQVLVGRGDAMEAVRVDVTDAAAVTAFIDDVASRHGRIATLCKFMAVDSTQAVDPDSIFGRWSICPPRAADAD